MANTFLFQGIPSQTLITTGSKTSKNSRRSGGGTNNKTIRTGRNSVGPICPYHMPTNYNRFNDPGINVPYKKVKDLIELKDINRLIERITLYTHLWNAEANDISKYGLRSKIRLKVMHNLKPLGTTLEPATEVQMTNGKNTIRQNTPYIRIGDYSAEEYQTLDKNIFATPSTFNQGPMDILVGEGSAITLPRVDTGKVQSTGNPLIFHCGQEKLYRVTTLLDASQNLILAYHDENIISLNETGLEGYSKNDQENIHFSINLVAGQIINKNKYFVFTYRTIDKDATQSKLRYIVFKLWFYDSALKQFNAAGTTETRETDWSVQEQIRSKRGKNPIINAREFNLIQQTLHRLIEALSGMANIVLSSVVDSTTRTDIANFKTSHVPYQTNFDKDEPDTNFYNYQAQSQALIKVGFYNTLVDAYKLLINSCMCNCDCACNSNCTCNTNCGCNYG